MSVGEVIRRQRKQQGLTQEQVAQRLGVSAPAVNKWEKGSTYPDITILPALARLLNTDVNTLLCFQQELSDNEIAEICNKIVMIWMSRAPKRHLTRRSRKYGSIRIAGS